MDQANSETVAFRYRLALEHFEIWAGVVTAVQAYDSKVKALRSAYDRDDPDTIETLLHEFAFKKNGAIPHREEPLETWLNTHCEPADMARIETAMPDGRTLYEIEKGEGEIETAFALLEVYSKALQSVLDKVAPAKFSYHGFEVDNGERFTESLARGMLEGIDYIVGLFKRRGCEKLLSAGLQRVYLSYETKSFGASETAHGLYITAKRSIVLTPKVTGSGGGRFLKDWVNEVFLHEFGHHVHLSYLGAEAKRFWDSGWQQVDEKKLELDNTVRFVTSDERRRYFELWKKVGWDIAKAVAKLEPLDKVKFGVWLRAPLTGDPLITAKQFRLTEHGKSVVKFLKDPDAVMLEDYDLRRGDSDYERRFDHRRKQLFSKLGIDYGGKFSVPSAVADELLKANPGLSKAVDDAIAALEIPSWYGKENEKEDFAETFVAFMDAPEKLTPTSKYRMQRTLWLSGLYGKKVVRLAKRPRRREA